MGFLIVDKPKGMTSQTVCLKIKHMLKAKKCGHNGTLDPNATGVMVVAVDSATKAIRLLNEHDKEYIATIQFGIMTPSLDMDTEIIDKMDMDIDIQRIREKMDILLSQKEQIPPMTSAVKIDGKKLYEYQREGKEVEVLPRAVTLYDYEIVSELRKNELGYEIDIRCFVSKGYFIRSLARDLGELLGGFAVIKELRRTKSGVYSIEQAIQLENITASDILDMKTFFNIPTVMVKDYMIPLVKNGITMDERQTNIDGVFYVDSKEGLLGIYEKVEQNKYKPVVLFKE